MGNLSQPISGVLKKIKTNQNWDKEIKNTFSQKEKKHIRSTTIYKGKLIINLDTNPALYDFRLRKEQILKKLKNRRIPFKEVVFKIGA